MCGIVGIIKLNGSAADPSVIQTMMRTIKHRGPDDDGTFFDNNTGFGYVRLSIIDTSIAGHQPMPDNSGRYMVIFNGEIFNYIELREELKEYYQFKTKTDSEVLLAAYIRWGKDFVNKLNGMWAFAIYDRVDQTVFISRDRYGEKPLYYFQNNEEFVFSSEIGALQKILHSKLNPDKKIIYEYLAYNRTDQSCDTFIKEIKRLQHGHNILVKGTKIISWKWYALDSKVHDPFSSSEEYYNLFISAVKLRLRSDVPLGMCLSGGLDSSSVTSTLINEFNLKDLHTFSAVYGRGVKGDESSYIELYQPQLSNLHYVYPTADTLLEDLDDLMKCHFEPFPSLSIYSQFKVMKDASKYVKVALDGQGADEQLAGYHNFFGSYYRELIREFKWYRLLIEMYYYLKKHNSTYALKILGFYMLPNQMKNSVRNKRVGFLDPVFAETFSSRSNLSNELYDPKNLKESHLQHFEYKLEHNLKWNDLNSMYHSLELRAPFMDYRLVEKTLATPPNMIINKGTTKWILRQALAAKMPESIRVRQDKVGFENPSDQWLKNERINTLVNEIIYDKSNPINEYINMKFVQNKYDLFRKEQNHFGPEVWKILNLNHFIKRLALQ